MNILKGKRILVGGKGGSGKTIFTSLLSKVLNHKGLNVAMLDADPSYLSGLPRLSMGMNNGPKSMVDFVKDNSPFGLDMKRTVPENIFFSDIPDQYFLHHGRTWLFQLGEMNTRDLNVEFFSWTINHFHLPEDFVTLIDSIAGIENYDIHINPAKDIFLILVSPEYESLLMAEKIFRFTEEKRMEYVWAVLNDFQSEKMEMIAKQQLVSHGIDVIGSISYDDQVRDAAFSGLMIPDCQAVETTRKIVVRLVNGIMKTSLNYSSG